MTTLGRRIRGALKMGALWGVAWGLAGGIVARVLGINSDLPLPLLFAPLGMFSGVVFSGVLVAMARRRVIDQLSVPRFAAWGATSGALLTGVIVAGALLRGANAWSEFLLFGPALIGAGTACAAGSLALARRGDRLELESSDETAPLLPR